MCLCEDLRRQLFKSRFPVLCELAVSKCDHPSPLLSTRNKHEKCTIIEVWRYAGAKAQSCHIILFGVGCARVAPVGALYPPLSYI
jgi:hypothetical protein